MPFEASRSAHVRLSFSCSPEFRPVLATPRCLLKLPESNPCFANDDEQEVCLRALFGSLLQIRKFYQQADEQENERVDKATEVESVGHLGPDVKIKPSQQRRGLTPQLECQEPTSFGAVSSLDVGTDLFFEVGFIVTSQFEDAQNFIRAEFAGKPPERLLKERRRIPHCTVQVNVEQAARLKRRLKSLTKKFVRNCSPECDPSEHLRGPGTSVNSLAMLISSRCVMVFIVISPSIAGCRRTRSLACCTPRFQHCQARNWK